MVDSKYVFAGYEDKHGVPVIHLEYLQDQAELLLNADVAEQEVDAHLVAWLELLKEKFGDGYKVNDSIALLMLSSLGESDVKWVNQFIRKCMNRVFNFFGEQCFAGFPGRVVLLVFSNQSDYYDYLQAYDDAGEFGASGGVQIREGYPHIALYWDDPYGNMVVIAHELLHLAGMHLDLPMWLDEGLAMMFEDDMTGSFSHRMSPENVLECKAFWRESELEMFWSGEGFHRPDEYQKYSYMLAEFISRNLVSNYGRRKWFKRKHPTDFVKFVLHAHYDDAGRSAAKNYLKIELEEVVEVFLKDIKRSDWY